MFKRLDLHELHTPIALIAFLFTLAVFATAMVRALKLHRDSADQLASLPLDDGPEGARPGPDAPNPSRNDHHE